MLSELTHRTRAGRTVVQRQTQQDIKHTVPQTARCTRCECRRPGSHCGGKGPTAQKGSRAAAAHDRHLTPPRLTNRRGTLGGCAPPCTPSHLVTLTSLAGMLSASSALVRRRETATISTRSFDSAVTAARGRVVPAPEQVAQGLCRRAVANGLCEARWSCERGVEPRRACKHVCLQPQRLAVHAQAMPMPAAQAPPLQPLARTRSVLLRGDGAGSVAEGSTDVLRPHVPLVHRAHAQKGK